MGEFRGRAPPPGATVAPMAEPSTTRPNILLVVSDQERQRSWLPPGVSLPWRDRLRAEGLEFTDYFTHSSPCSPSRASLFTGRYLEGHGVLDNVIMPEHDELPTSTPTLGSLLDGPATAPPTSASGTSPTRPPRTWRPTASPTGTATTATSWAGPAPACTSTRSSPPTPPTGSRRTPPAGATGSGDAGSGRTGSGGPSPGSSPWPWSTPTT